MTTVNLQLSSSLRNKLNFLLRQYSSNDEFAKQVIDSEILQIKRAISNIESDLAEFEKKYRLTSKIFYTRFSNGKLPDNEDFIIWAGIYELMLNNYEKLKKLK